MNTRDVWKMGAELERASVPAAALEELFTTLERAGVQAARIRAMRETAREAPRPAAMTSDRAALLRRWHAGETGLR